MKRPGRLLTAAVGLPFMAGCFTTAMVPVPPPTERADTEIRGVVVQGPDGGDGERLEFAELFDVQWTAEALSVVGRLVGAPESAAATSRSFSYEELAGVLVRQVDANKTSGLLGGVIVGTIAIVAILINGQVNENTRIPGPGG
jgi:hypothetical protein